MEIKIAEGSNDARQQNNPCSQNEGRIPRRYLRLAGGAVSDAENVVQESHREYDRSSSEIENRLHEIAKEFRALI